MPLYEYRCLDCKMEVEVLLSRSYEQPECPNCGSVELDRLLSVPAAPAVRSETSRLPSLPAGCEAPRCCGGGCHLP